MPERQVAAQPVRLVPGDDDAQPEGGLAVCLSGGGFRAMLFHAGALWRLSDLGILPRVDRFSSVSGGSIAAAQLASSWPVAPGDFERRVIVPLRRLAGMTLDVPLVVIGLLSRGTIAEHAAAVYRRVLFGRRTLQDLPERPRFIFNATNLATGGLFRFSRPYLGDWRIGRLPHPKLDLATAVAASAAFPPPLSPLRLDLPPDGWDLSGAELLDREYRSQVRLSDGGVYDNLGIETAWKRCRTVLISDASGALWPGPRPSDNLLLQMPRVIKTFDAQVRALRIGQVLDAFDRGDRDGAFWSMRDPLDRDLCPPGALPAGPEWVRELARVPTRLARMPPLLQERLINWGYACADASVRTHVAKGAEPPSGFPYPQAGFAHDA